VKIPRQLNNTIGICEEGRLTLAGWNGITAKQISPAAIDITDDMQHCGLGVWKPVPSLTDYLNATACREVPTTIHTFMHRAVPNQWPLAYCRQQ